ncbi:Clp protease N-terminal domain-containing protein [Nocardia sp. GCM10030253]|uniref:Clp protease N-terminal domain-containing protein n=1 Tax=Nocardia sp. GCM10030253 TaxID=3273404 RepID=UPI003643BD55
MAVFDKFSVEARRVVVLAHEESRQLGHDYIGAEHLLVAVLRHPSPTHRRPSRRCGAPRSKPTSTKAPVSDQPTCCSASSPPTATW